MPEENTARNCTSSVVRKEHQVNVWENIPRYFDYLDTLLPWIQVSLQVSLEKNQCEKQHHKVEIFFAK